MLLIYGLQDPRNKRIRYIGQSCRGLRRPAEHLEPARLEAEKRTHCAKWIKSLLKIGLTYDVIVLEYVVEAALLDAAEVRWIAHGFAAGWSLTNHTAGGGIRGYKHTPRTPETLARMSAAQKGRTLTAEHREKLRTANLGKKTSKETREKQSLAHRGVRHSETVCAKIRKTKRSQRFFHLLVRTTLGRFQSVAA